MRSIILLSLCLLPLGLAACTPAEAPKTAPAASQLEQPAPKVKVEELALSVDPFCNMSMKDHPIADVATHEGKTYGFCSSYCKDEFLKDPAKYLAKAAAPAP